MSISWRPDFLSTWFFYSFNLFSVIFIYLLSSDTFNMIHGSITNQRIGEEWRSGLPCPTSFQMDCSEFDDSIKLWSVGLSNLERSWPMLTWCLTCKLPQHQQKISCLKSDLWNIQDSSSGPCSLWFVLWIGSPHSSSSFILKTSKSSTLI